MNSTAATGRGMGEAAPQPAGPPVSAGGVRVGRGLTLPAGSPSRARSPPTPLLMEVFRGGLEEVEMIQEVDAMGGARPSCGLLHPRREVADVHPIASPSDTLSVGRRPR